MSISIVQNAFNHAAYQVQPLTVTLKAATTAGSRIALVVEAQKSGYPYSSGSIQANTPAPTVTDDKGNVYTLVKSLVSIAQDAGLQPDAAGYFQSLYFYVSGVAGTGTQNVFVSGFYTDEYNSPPLSPPVHGRPVFDGGISVQAFEVAGLTVGVDQSGAGASYSASNPLGPNLITTSGAAIIFEVGVLLDSAALISNTNATPQHSSGVGSGGTSHFVVQSTIVGTATASAGFGNALKYSGGVIAVSLK